MRSRVLMVAMDAADLRLVQRWMQDGSLPNLRSLCSNGVLAPIKNPEHWLSGATWPTFYTGTPPEAHGLYHFLQWDARRMSFMRPNADWIPLQPFWRRIASEACPVVVIDPPTTYTPEPIDGIEIIGYAAHDNLNGPSSFPPEYMSDVRRRLGAADLPETVQSPSAAASDRLRDHLVAATQKIARLGAELLESKEWRFALICFTATHRAGHRLWRVPGSPDGEPSEALKAVYVACDAGLGKVLRAAGGDVACIVFSLHGMQENTSRVDVLAEMLELVLGHDPPAPRAAGGTLLDALRGWVPETVKSPLKARLPMALRDRLSSDRWTRSIDWSSKRAFPLISDLLGYIRINLRGREALGIVEPGAEYERLCETIAAGLPSFRDGDTGRPVVERVIRLRSAADEPPRASLLPDLAVHWSPEPARHHRVIVSPDFGSVAWPTPGGHPTGRSGNHHDGGFLIASGGGFDARSHVGDISVLDLLPTVYSLLGLNPPAEARGTAIPARH